MGERDRDRARGSVSSVFIVEMRDSLSTVVFVSLLVFVENKTLCICTKFESEKKNTSLIDLTHKMSQLNIFGKETAVHRMSIDIEF